MRFNIRSNIICIYVLLTFLGGELILRAESLSNWFSIVETGYNVSQEQPCNTTPDLTAQQKILCQNEPNTLAFIANGIYMSLTQCQKQFRIERWNCSTESYINLPAKGTKESAFIYSLTSAALAHSIARACSTGNLTTCSCAKSGKWRKKRQGLFTDPMVSNWKWGGCSDNVNYGVKFSQKFGDAPEEELHESVIGAQSMVHLHNNKVGRKLVAQKMKTKCRCHGPSGACVVKMCWRILAPFTDIGDELKRRYDRSAVQVMKRKTKRLRPVDKSIDKSSLKSQSLVYTSRSPDFCVKHTDLGIQGVKGRQCNRTGIGVDSCSSLCCGRGYNTQLLEYTDNCDCKFHWCCHVTCRKCSIIKEAYTCK